MKTAQLRNPCFRLRKSRIQGRGAFATRLIREGTCIVEYTGERISDDEAERRYDDDASDRHHTFLFAVESNVNIDGAVGGNEAAFINHSCDPNCEAVATDKRIYIHALRTIQPGTDVTYDYRYARQGTTEAEARRIYPCRCGTAACRGTILAPEKKKKRKTAKKASRRAR